MAIVSVQRARRKRQKQFKQECEQLDRIVDEIQNPALGKLVSFNFRLTDRFISVALGQAGASFLACSVAASAALLVLLAGAATVLTVDSGRARLTVGLLTAAGTTLSGYLSVTFVHTFEMTSRQMSYYYGQPLVHCYLLHAEWLAARFEADATAERCAYNSTGIDCGCIKCGHQRARPPTRPSNADKIGSDLCTDTRRRTSTTGVEIRSFSGLNGQPGLGERAGGSRCGEGGEPPVDSGAQRRHSPRQSVAQLNEIWQPRWSAASARSSAAWRRCTATEPNV